MSGSTDAQKLVSSLTLFASVATTLGTANDDEGRARFAEVAEQILGGGCLAGLPALPFHRGATG